MNYRDEVINSAAYALMTAKNPAQAYLITSPDENFSLALAAEFAANRLKTDSSRILRKAAADVIFLPFGDKVLASDVKELVDSVTFTPTESHEKIYIVEKAETMNDASQNKLLKVLEEPPSFVRIILIASTTAPFLSTVLSRVTHVDVPPFTEEKILDSLTASHGDSTDVYLAAALCGGSFSKAEKMLGERKHVEIYDAVVDTLKNMKSSKNALPFSAKLGSFASDLDEIIDVMEIIFSDCANACEGRRAHLKIKSGVRDVLEISENYDSDVIVRLRPKIVRARRRLKFNGNAQSVLDELLFSMLEVKAKCRK